MNTTILSASKGAVVAGPIPAVVRPEIRKNYGFNITSHAVGMVVIKTDPNFQPLIIGDDVEVVSIDYTTRGRTTKRLPMGKGNPGEGWLGDAKREGTIRRELLQEVGMKHVHLISEKPLYFNIVNDDVVPGAHHLKVFFMVAAPPVHSLRSYGIVEHEGQPGEEFLSPPRWTPLAELLQFMQQPEGTKRDHLQAALATAAHFSASNRAVCYTHSRILSQYQEDLARQTTDRRMAVGEYLTAYKA